MGFSTSTCTEFVEVLASKAPVPGGGGASALVGAVGTALGNMVGSLTVGKKKYADVEDEMYELKAKCDQLQKDFLRLIERDAEAKDSNRHTADNDRSFIGTKPYDKQRCQRRFRQTVQHHEIRLRDFRKLGTGPQQNCHPCTQNHNEQETDQCFRDRYRKMGKNRTISAHTAETSPDHSRTAENKRIDQPGSGRDFPQSQKEKKNKDP